MGEVMDSSAGIDDIEEDVRQAHQDAVAPGGAIAEAATARLAQSVAAMDMANDPEGRTDRRERRMDGPRATPTR